MAAKIVLVLCLAAAAHAHQVIAPDPTGYRPYGPVAAYDPAASLGNPYLTPGADLSPYSPYPQSWNFGHSLSHPVIKPLQPVPSAASLLYPYPQPPVEVPIEAYAPGPAAYNSYFHPTTPGYAQNPISYALRGTPAVSPQTVLGSGNYAW